MNGEGFSFFLFSFSIHFFNKKWVICKMIEQNQVEQLPLFYTKTIPDEFRDLMGHMNIQWYVHLFDQAAHEMFGSFGMSDAYFIERKNGMFALEQHIRYVNEVLIGETVNVHSRILGYSAKRVHFMHHMINVDSGKLSATMEVVGAHIDMGVRRMSPFPPDILEVIAEWADEHGKLGWESPVCGVMGA